MDIDRRTTLAVVHRDGLASGSCVRVTLDAARMSDSDALATAIRSLVV